MASAASSPVGQRRRRRAPVRTAPPARPPPRAPRPTSDGSATCSSTACTRVPKAAPPGSRVPGRRPPRAAASSPPAAHGRHLLEVALVVLLRDLRLAAEPLLVRRRGERAVGRAPPAGVQRPAERRRAAAPAATSGRRPDGRRPGPHHLDTHPAAARRRPRPERGQRRRRRSAPEADCGATGRAVVQQQPVQRCGRRVVRRRPPDQQVRLRPGERDVGEPQLVVASPRPVLAHVRGPVGAARAADVAHPVVVVVVEDRGRPGRRPPKWSQANGTSTTGNSSPLLVCTVMICTAAASVSSRRLRSWPPSPAASARRRRSQTSSAVSPSWPSSAASCSDLGDVPQVGEQPLAADRARTRGCSRSVERHRLEQRGHPAVLEHGAPDPQPQRQVVGEGVAGRVQPGRVEPDEAGQRCPAYPGGAVRLLQRLEQPLPLRGRRGGEDATSCR